MSTIIPLPPLQRGNIVYDEVAEKQIIGAMIEHPLFIPTAQKLINASMFYRVPHQLIYEAITTLYQEYNAIDAIMVGQYLKGSGDLNRIGGNEYITDLVMTSVVEVIENFEFHCHSIYECYVKREIESIMKRGLSQVQGGESDSDAIIGQIITKLSEISSQRHAFISIDEAIISVENDINQRIASKGAVVSYGSKLIDATLGGIKPNQMVIIAGKPSSGKTSLLQSIAVNVAMQDKPALFLSYETSPNNLAKRYIASSSDITYVQLDVWRKDDWWKEFGESFRFAQEQIKGKQLFFDYSQSPIEEVFGLCHHFKMMYPETALIGVDYMQIIPSLQKGLSKYERVSMVSNVLTRIARKLNICVIAISQMSRSIDRRADQEPTLSDLRNSGEIEQDADVVMFVQRPWTWDKSVDPHFAELKIAKNRNGALENIPLKFYPEKFLFKE